MYFNLIQLQNESGEDNGYEVEFNFENESLKHKLKNTMRENMFEVTTPNALSLNTLYVVMD